MDFLELAKSRYSCRKLSGRKVEKQLLDKIIAAGIAAPTAVNQQPYKIWVLQSEEAVRFIGECTNCTFGAEVFLIVGCRESESWTRSFDGQNFAEVDAAIAATHMLLEIQDLGLATTWVGWFDAPKLQKQYPQMAGYHLIALFPVGYAAEDAVPSPKHESRRSPEEACEYL